jgi:hypothetical protein
MEYDVNRFDGDLIINKGNLTRLNHSFAGISYGQSNGKSFYNGANFSVKKRFSHGVEAQVAYTFGKAVDYASSFGGGLSIVDVGNLKLNRGLADFDIRNKVAIVALYQLPSPLKSGLGRAVLGGWELSGTTIIQSGSPFSVYCNLPFNPIYSSTGQIIGNSGCDFNADGFNYDYLNVPALTQRSGWSKQQWLNGAFLASDFPKPGFGQDGTLSRNAFIGPGYSNTNLDLEKKFNFPLLGEAGKVTFRTEFYNLFNQTNLTGLDTNTADSLFGHATSSFATRNVQFGLKIIF